MGILWIVLLLIVLLVATQYFRADKSNNSQQKSTQPKRNRKQINDLRKIDLEGVWFNKGERREAFAETQEGDTVMVTFDYGNQYDKNALGVYTKTGKLLGYIPKNNKRVIGAFRKQPERMATIIYKNNGSSQYEKGIRIEFSIAE